MMEKVQEDKEIPPLSPLNKGGAEGGGIVYFDKESVSKRGLTWNGSHLPYNSNNVDRARAMRREMTLAEKKLWYGFLRTFKYRVLRQRPIDHYIADFYCAKLKLVIELDGKHHLATAEYDKNRSEILQLYGLRILRFSNEQIFKDYDNVCKQIGEIPP
jgi:very-short-patch-repair endonuclease